MISKIAPTAAALLMVSSVNGFDYMKMALDKRTINFDTTLGCAICIQNGYSFVFDALKTSKTNSELVATTKDYKTKNTSN